MPEKTEQYELEQHPPRSGSPPAYSTIQPLPVPSREAGIAPPPVDSDSENYSTTAQATKPVDTVETDETVGDDIDSTESEPEKKISWRSVIFAAAIIVFICAMAAFLGVGIPVLYVFCGGNNSSSTSSFTYASVFSMSPTSIR